jgi:hypothetical protein
MRIWPISLLICLWFFAIPLCAEPENILVDKYTFARPKHWKWKATGDKWSALSRFLISAEGAKHPTDVRFYMISEETADLRKRVLANFRNPVEETVEGTKVGNIELTYFTGKGTAVDRETKKDPRPDHQFTCVLLPSTQPGKHVFLRLLGPRREVEGALKDFKAMVEQAVKESQ